MKKNHIDINQQKKEIKKIHDDAILKIKKLAKKRDDIVIDYIKKLEAKKIGNLLKSLKSE